MSNENHKDFFVTDTSLSIGYVKRIIIQDDTGGLHDLKDLTDDDYNKLLASFGLLILARAKLGGNGNAQTTQTNNNSCSSPAIETTERGTKNVSTDKMHKMRFPPNRNHTTRQP